MSAEFIDVFFPSSSYLLRTRHSQFVQRLFPQELQLKCSRPVHLLFLDGEGRHAIPIRWPSLAPVTFFGIAIGIHGYIQLQRKGRRPPTPSWSLAMVFYALMNVAALGSHCLVSRTSYWQPSLVSLDIAGTACCAFSAMYACISDELSGGFRAGAAAKTWIADRKKHMVNLLLGNGLLNISAFAGLLIPFMAELLYIGTAMVAVVVVGSYMRRRPAVGRQRRWMRLTFGGGALALSGIPLDATLCRQLGPHVHHVTLLFAGCHLAVVGMFLYVREELVVRYDDAGAGAAADAGQVPPRDGDSGDAVDAGRKTTMKGGPRGGTGGRSARKRE